MDNLEAVQPRHLLPALTYSPASPDFLSSRPTEANRSQQIQALLPTVMPLYTAARR